jgi:hypothetical protein
MNGILGKVAGPALEHGRKKEERVSKYRVYFPTVILLLTALANAATPAITAFWANHAGVAAIVAPLALLVAHWLPSPYAGGKQ